MSSSTQSTITESELLTTFLLTPSPLPTITPYSTFLTLVPQSYRNNPEHAPSLTRLYRDLQFQRSITIDQVRINIERECSTRAATLRTRLARRIAIEDGDQSAERKEANRILEMRKRKRDKSAFIDHQRHSSDGEEDEQLETGHDEFTDPREIDAQRTFHEHESMFHPAAHVLPFETSSKRRKGEANAAFHTQSSLLRRMEIASDSLAREIAELDRECAKLGAQMKETVEGLSDLKYGKARTSKEQEKDALDDESSAYAEVMSALNTFQDLLKSKTQTSTLVAS